ncbi:hypothetical protein TALK_12170 [Thalassospira alkalitolerans]|uniref:Uncharacterized protein n=1 Tax=Thalassospira alkalitolerans TaxID=1293890 RepID=A0A1Y2LAV4_9PROT|nr:hypothetical protein TALK_12170 [Thalassospira alkalitolerans]
MILAGSAKKRDGSHHPRNLVAKRRRQGVCDCQTCFFLAKMWQPSRIELDHGHDFLASIPKAIFRRHSYGFS